MGVNRGLDEEEVSAWLSAHVAEVVPPFTFSLIAGGRSNLTFEVVDGRGSRFVLRRPPLGHVLATAHDMGREHRLISAVGTTSVPVPRALGLCQDVDVTGAPFYVMSFVDGVVLDSPEKAALLPASRRRAAAFDLIDVLAELHLLDVDAIGLGDLAKRTGYVERQLRRWSKQWQDSKTRELPAIEEVEARLRSGIPVQQAVSVAHGDYRFGNCLTDPVLGRIAAVLDWELCTLGDPLADVGYLRVYWADPVEADGRTLGGRHNDPTPAGGFPSYDELVERYARRTGFDLSGIEYYVAFSSWRLAVISEGVYARYLHGAMADGDGVDLSVFRQGTEELAEGALAAARRLGGGRRA
jgi:aminoglycoside phosphotransferase (APT) family kinase protein